MASTEFKKLKKRFKIIVNHQPSVEISKVIRSKFKDAGFEFESNDLPYLRISNRLFEISTELSKIIEDEVRFNDTSNPFTDELFLKISEHSTKMRNLALKFSNFNSK